MRYLVARGANSPAVSTILASWQENLTVRDPSRAPNEESSFDSCYSSCLDQGKKMVFHHENKGQPHPSPPMGKTPGTAIPVSGGGKRRTGAHRFCRDSAP